jgi:phage gpG-like protein
LGLHNNLGPGIAAYMTWEPSIGIATTRIDKLSMDIRSFKEPLTRAIREVMVPSIRKNFDVGGRPAWEPLSDETWIIRSKFGWTGGDILMLTGTLRKVASQMNIWTITQNSATIRDLPQQVWYGKVHQAGYEGQSMSKLARKLGGDMGAALKEIQNRQKIAMATGTTLSGSGERHSPSIPARPFLVFQPEDEQDIQDVFMEWLEERVNRAWPPVGG